MSIKNQLDSLNRLSVVVAKDFDYGISENKVSFSVRGILEIRSGYYRLNIDEYQFVSFELSDVVFIQNNRIELR